ncbi:MAG: dihydrofolate reductase [Peptoniphilaceae bacterium]|nr:dihydrofolate reductase [Peptoniphilaceae bacterium]MDY6019710.1 dihydrofolate reductase [Anaerococcus sp.]
MKIILAVDDNFAIGKNNKLLFHIKKDLKHFKNTTLNSILIMGRKTYESMGGALSFRDNLILTRNKAYKADDAKVFTSKDEILAYVNNKPDKDAFVIGGGEIVKVFLDYCDEVILTKVMEKVDHADTFLHNFDLDPDFEIVEQSSLQEENGVKFKYVIYRRKK